MFSWEATREGLSANLAAMKEANPSGFVVAA